MKPDTSDVVVCIQVTISLWDAIKARIAGIQPQMDEIRHLFITALDKKAAQRETHRDPVCPYCGGIVHNKLEHIRRHHDTRRVRR